LQANLPKELLISMKGIKGFDEAAFIKVHQSTGQVTSIRLNPEKYDDFSRHENFPDKQQIPWSSQGYYLPERPAFTLDPLLHAGAYYVQEASSMFLEQAIKQTVDLSNPIRILDLCAAPGGKSTLIQSIISEDSLLVSNEVIQSRVNVLRENLVKWGGANVIVTNNDPSSFSTIADYFDVIIVDAPCSGSGLFRKDPSCISKWSEEQVELCSRRQERILADVWPALKHNGILIYATCSYSKQEDEDILDWLMSSFSMDSQDLVVDPVWGITRVQSDKHQAYGYRFYPDQLKGEGFFLACFKKTGGDLFSYPNNKKQQLEQLTRTEKTLLGHWVEPGQPYEFFKRDGIVYALPALLLNDFVFLQTRTYLKKAGIRVGKFADSELIPEHELALSGIYSKDLPFVELTRKQAIDYLRKKEVNLDLNSKGWMMVRHYDQNLGWVKVLDKRINNYYPKEWRITQQG
jgi:16S rRNA C967 or C1407 C5-methylase (RsmB/RsmF family)/NOL1/NOP2/fmu family ribosome biogenesis protein